MTELGVAVRSMNEMLYSKSVYFTQAFLLDGKQ